MLLAVASLVACQNDSKLDSKGGSAGGAASGDLEARVKKLEADNAKHAEALDFLDKVYAQQKGQQEAQEREEPAPDAIFAVDIAQNLKAGQVEGPATAPVTIVEAFDFACPYCRQVSDTLESLVKDYNGKVRVVFKNMVVHPQVATTAHLASCAAAKQGKYPQFKNALWTKGFDAYAAAHDPSKLGEENILAIAKDVGLDVDKLKVDMKSEECKTFLENDRKELDKFHVNSTPTLFVNGTHVGGALPEQQFKTMIDEKLKLVEQSGVPAAEYYDKEVMGKGEKQFRSKKDPKPS
ncbi:MAG: thioredoxin domain-containing protein [Kofleriaceae bacterium]